MKKPIIFLAVTIPLIYYIMASSQLPDSVPVHFNIYGEPDRYGSKQLYLFLAGLPIITLFLFNIYIRYTKSSKNLVYQNKMINGLVLMFAAISMIFTYSVVNNNFSNGRGLVIIFSLLFIYLGNMFNKLEPNKTFGIRIPSTLNSEYVWNRVHFIGGYTFVITGVASLIAALLISNQVISLSIFIILLLINVIGISIYSHLLYKREQASRQ